jgi:NACalpha-BTF3-like transcription factor
MISKDEILAKLHKTKDGVRVVPGVDIVYIVPCKNHYHIHSETVQMHGWAGSRTKYQIKHSYFYLANAEKHQNENRRVVAHSQALKKVDNYRMKILEQLLDKCNEGCRKTFIKMVSEYDINWAIEQCEKALAAGWAGKSQKKPE